MNGSRAASLTVAWRFAALHIEGFPWIASAILGAIALVAIFANVLAPYNPEIGVLGDRFRPPAWQYGGCVDQVIMRVTDTWLAIPALTYAIFLAAVVGPSQWNIVIILALVYWTRYARVIRGEVLSLRERDFVRIAIVAGCSKKTIMRR